MSHGTFVPNDSIPTLYIKPFCPWCIAAVEQLNQLGVPFEKVNVLTDRSAYRRMIEISGQRLTPTLEYQDRVLADFGPTELGAFVRQGHLSDFIPPEEAASEGS
ncbi:MAG: glutaredoxin family protein [Verrucomicrobiota bacterium]|jgi:glutaredoxin|nr:glutaredoxin family protein [Verrucomicrobiota bacterium]MDD8051102.1 glutaredoxin family protein [Verrucomicrobiota bacterium]MDI9382970.1 glutaredoxin family protein [Verrucomicrobiota bacterium]HCF93845.1 NrdH-redoxin [Verrucomicrobiota bacterium]